MKPKLVTIQIKAIGSPFMWYCETQVCDHSHGSLRGVLSRGIVFIMVCQLYLHGTLDCDHLQEKSWQDFYVVLFGIRLVHCTCGSSDHVRWDGTFKRIPVDTHQPTTSIKLKDKSNNQTRAILIYNFNMYFNCFLSYNFLSNYGTELNQYCKQREPFLCLLILSRLTLKVA